jgi:predicted LPLAT superfamily acyltransferase
MSQPPATSAKSPRNPGPGWGYGFLCLADKVLPEVIFKPLRALGTGIALAGMSAQRAHSRAYLRIILGREPRCIEVFRHFFTFEEALMLKLRVANGRPHRGVLAPGAVDFQTFLHSTENAFLGSFHIGHSDLIGFVFGDQEQRRIVLVRQRVGNSHDVDGLAKLFGRWVSFIWVNEGENLLFALKDAVAGGGSIALKCDRVEFSSRTGVFRFLGANRVFPFTIYHLGIIFDRPVLLCLGIPAGPNESRIHSSPRWANNPALSRAENLASAHAHFQNFLDSTEELLRENPYLWFNYIELNPEADAA